MIECFLIECHIIYYQEHILHISCSLFHTHFYHLELVGYVSLYQNKSDYQEEENEIL